MKQTRRARAYATFATLIGVLTCALLPVRSFAAELLVVTRPNCGFCKAWEIQVGGIYPKTAEAKVAPLRRVNIGDLAGAGYVLDEPVVYTPSFILVDGKLETGRIVGYFDDAMFWGLLKELFDRLPLNATKAAGRPPHGDSDG